MSAEHSNTDPLQVDTIAKRLMSNQGKVGQALASWILVLIRWQIASTAQLNTVIFKDKAVAPAGKKFFSLFPGLGYAAGYKVSYVSKCM